MKVGILAFPEAISSSVVGPYDILKRANTCFTQLFPRHEGDKFDVTLIGYPMDSLSSHALLPIAEVMDADMKFDLIIIPAPSPEHLEKIMQNGQDMFGFIKNQWEKGAEVASICVGAFLVAAAGIIDHKRVTTHWIVADELRRFFPNVIVEDDRIILDEGGIYSCGGAFTFTTLIMYLVEKFCGHETAVLASKILLIDLYKDPQSSYHIFSLQRQHNDKEVKVVQEIIEKKYTVNHSLNELGEKVSLSRRTLIRRFKKATGNTPLEYLQRVRVEAAKKQLEISPEPIESIPAKVGYEDYGSFLNVFKKYAGVSPSSYRKSYGHLGELAIA